MSWTDTALICDWCECPFVAGDVAIPGYTMASQSEPDDPRHYHLGCLVRGEEKPAARGVDAPTPEENPNA